MRQNAGMVLKDLKALEKEMRMLRQRIELANLYNNQMDTNRKPP
jgi:hypothetical protein